MNTLRCFWDVSEGWCVETPVALSKAQVARCVEWVRKTQGPRVAAMRGDKREQAGAALASLTIDTLKQRVLAAHGAERVLFSR